MRMWPGSSLSRHFEKRAYKRMWWSDLTNLKCSDHLRDTFSESPDSWMVRRLSFLTEIWPISAGFNEGWDVGAQAGYAVL